MQTVHWIKHLVGAPPDVTIHHYEDDGFAMSAIYEGDVLVSTIERCGEGMMVTHYRKWGNEDGRRETKSKN